MSKKLTIRQDLARPSCSSHHVVKCGRPLGRQRYLCRDCGRYFLGNASYYHRSRSNSFSIIKLKEEVTIENLVHLNS